MLQTTGATGVPPVAIGAQSERILFQPATGKMPVAPVAPAAPVVQPATDKMPVAPVPPPPKPDFSSRKDILDDPKLNAILEAIPGATVADIKDRRR